MGDSNHGIRFGRYRLLEVLGAGGMAVVHRAVIDGPKGFHRAVVIKRILPELSQDESFVEMLVQEARLCGLLHHPGIVQVLELGEIGGEYFVAMELVEGVDLRSILQRCKLAGRQLPPGVACYVIAELASALGYAHALRDAQGRHLEIVHRDVSPSNVMVSQIGGVKLLDFGIAKAASCVRDEHTRTGALKGKIAYMSPEQAEGRAIDHRSDLFALGILFWECLCVQRLFGGQTDFERLRKVRLAEVVPPSTVVPGLDPDLDAIVMKMLAQKPDDRFQTGYEIVAALEPLIHRLHGSASSLRALVDSLPPAPPQRPIVPSLAELSPASPSTKEGAEAAASSFAGGTITRSTGQVASIDPQRDRSKRSPLWSGGLSLALVALAAVAGSLAVPKRKPPAAQVAATGAAPSQPVPGPSPRAPVAAPALPAPVAATAPVAAPAAPLVVVVPPLEAARPKEPKDTPRSMRLQIWGPTHAQVMVDGELVGELPLDVQLQPLPRTRRVTVARDGYSTWTRDIRGDQSASLTANLRRRPPPSRKVSTGALYDPFGQ